MLSKKQLLSQIRQFFKNHEWTFIFIAAIAVFSIGLYGHCSYYKPHGIIEYLRMGYLTLQMFFLNSSIPPNEALLYSVVLSQIVAPVIFGYSAWKASMVLFRDQIKLLALRLWKNHIVICGLGEKGVRLALEYISAGEKVVVIESDGENDDIPVCKNAGAIVLVGNATHSSMLKKARIEFSRCIYAISGDDSTNIAVGYKISSVIQKKKKKFISCYVHITDTAMRVLTAEQDLFYAPVKGIDYEIINVNDIAARSLFENNHLDYKKIDHASQVRVHLIISGFGGVGESVALHSLHQGHFANGKKIRLTIVDKDAKVKESFFRARYPGIELVANVDFYDIEIGSNVFFDMLREWSKESDTLMSVAFCLNNANRNVSFSLTARQYLQNIPVYVRLDQKAGAAAILSLPNKDGESSRLIPFGMLNSLCTPDVIEKQSQDILARTIYYDSREYKSDKYTGEEDNKGASWEFLDLAQKEYFRAEADHIPVKLRAVGYSFSLNNPDSDNLREIEYLIKNVSGNVEMMAKMEYARECSYSLLFRNGFIGLHDGSSVPVSWEQLTMDRQKYYISKIHKIPGHISKSV
jgi:hypothetical protein